MKAVDGASFEIADGEIMGLAGESGCGKSTLGKSLIRMDARMKYVDGRVELDGKELPISRRREDERRSASRRSRSSRSTRMSALNPTRRIGTMADGPARVAATSSPSRRCRSSSAGSSSSGLRRDVLARFPIELSGGMKQRVVMVLSSLLDPSLLIADEVTSALDVSTQRAVAELLVEFRDRGLRQEHDRDHPRPLRPLPDRRHDPRHVRGQARREGAGRDDRSRRRGTRTRSC